MTEETANNNEEYVYDDLIEPPMAEVPRDHKIWGKIDKALREVYDPEIPVNIYELGLVYEVKITDREDGKHDVYVQMSLTSPGCPVAQEMPAMVQAELMPLPEIENVDVEIVWYPQWYPNMMSETAKLELNMFSWDEHGI